MTLDVVQIGDSLNRARILLQSATALLQCAQDLEANDVQISSSLFLIGELDDALEKIEDCINPGPRGEAGNDV